MSDEPSLLTCSIVFLWSMDNLVYGLWTMSEDRSFSVLHKGPRNLPFRRRPSSSEDEPTIDVGPTRCVHSIRCQRGCRRRRPPFLMLSTSPARRREADRTPTLRCCSPRQLAVWWTRWASGTSCLPAPRGARAHLRARASTQRRGPAPSSPATAVGQSGSGAEKKQKKPWLVARSPNENYGKSLCRSYLGDGDRLCPLCPRWHRAQLIGPIRIHTTVRVRIERAHSTGVARF